MAQLNHNVHALLEEFNEHWHIQCQNNLMFPKRDNSDSFPVISQQELILWTMDTPSQSGRFGTVQCFNYCDERVAVKYLQDGASQNNLMQEAVMLAVCSKVGIRVPHLKMLVYDDIKQRTGYGMQYIDGAVTTDGAGQAV